MTEFEPSFVLRGMDHNKFWQRYWSGEFSQRTLPTTEKVSRGTFQMKCSVGSSILDPQFSYYDTSNSKIVCATSNCGKAKTCAWCHRSVEGKERCGVPLFVNWDPQPQPRFDGYTCDRRCTLRLILENKKLPYRSRDPLWSNSEKLLRQLHRAETSEPLVPANDWRLLDINGGALSEKEWEAHNYHRTSNILPGDRVLYQRL